MSREPDERSLTPDERSLESSLGQLAPAATACTRDRLLFEAGRGSAQRQIARWRLAALALFVASLTIAFWPGASPTVHRGDLAVDDTSPRERVEAPRAVDAGPQQPTIAPPPPFWVADAADNSYLALRQRVLAGGVEAIPVDRVGRGPETVYRLRDVYPRQGHPILHATQSSGDPI